MISFLLLNSLTEYVIGIDLGTTYSCISVVKDGRAEIVPSANGKLTLPSYISVLDNGELLFGHEAKARAQMHPESTFFNIKRLIGRHFKDPAVQQEIKLLPFQVINVKDRPTIRYKNFEYSPEQLSSLLLSHMRQLADNYLNSTVSKAVITVPAYFSDQQRVATRDAARIAGLQVLRLINEPTSAALAYGLQAKKQQSILVFDLGGGTFDVSLLQLKGKQFKVKAVGGDTHLGGEDFDQNLLKFLGLEVETPEQKQRLKKAAESLKICLSKQQACLFEEGSENLIGKTKGGKNAKGKEVTRKQFEDINAELFNRTIAAAKAVLKDAKFSAVDHIVLVGGSTLIPKIQQMLKSQFRADLYDKLDPDQTVAIGAAIQAYQLFNKDQKYNFKLLDVIPLSLGTKLYTGEMSAVLKRNSRIPARNHLMYSTVVKNQEIIRFQVLEGESLMAENNQLLCDFTVTNIRKGPAGWPLIKVQFEVDEDGILNINASELGGWGKGGTQLKADRSRFDPKRVEEMIENARKMEGTDKQLKKTAVIRYEMEQKILEIESILKQKRIQNPRFLEIKEWFYTNRLAEKSQFQVFDGELKQIQFKLQKKPKRIHLRKWKESDEVAEMSEDAVQRTEFVISAVLSWLVLF